MKVRTADQHWSRDTVALAFADAVHAVKHLAPQLLLSEGLLPFSATRLAPAALPEAFAVVGERLGHPSQVLAFEQELEARLPWFAHYTAVDALARDREQTARIAAYIVGVAVGLAVVQQGGVR